ncbi:MAG: GGDEF domain-containing protein [Dictyoglomaceae bacterium]
MYKEIKEKAGRFFDIQIFSLLVKDKDEYKLVSSLGCKDKNKILSMISEERPNQYKYFLRGDLGIIFIQQKYPLTDKELKIYTIFSRKIEELLNVLQSVKTQKEYEENLRKLSLTDDITGLYNRRGFTTLVEQQMKTLERLQIEGVLIYIDIDDMKTINDKHGHLVGDDCLVNFSLLLKKTFRKSDIIARVGGDEFAVFCLRTSKDLIESLLYRLNKNVEEFNTLENKPYKISISLGYAIYEKDKKLTLREEEKNSLLITLTLQHNLKFL